MLKVYVNDKEQKAEIEFKGNLTTMSTDVSFVIMTIYKEMLEAGKEDHAHAFRDMMTSQLSHIFEEVDCLLAFKHNTRHSAEIQELLDEILKRRG